MARSARHIGVAVSQREAKRQVVKFPIRPFGDGVALRACGRGGREAGRNVVRDVAAKRRRLVPIRKMAADAIRGIQRVVVVDVARGTGCRSRRHVRPCQGKAGYAVVEGSRIPALGGVAVGAVGGGECRAGRRVHRIIGLLPVRQVATGVPAIRRRDLQIIVVVHMAGEAGHIGVAVRQRKTRGSVIEIRRIPPLGRMAIGTVR